MFKISYKIIFVLVLLCANAANVSAKVMYVYDKDKWIISKYETNNFNVLKQVNVKALNYRDISKVSNSGVQVRFTQKCGITHYDDNKGIIRLFDKNTLNLIKTVKIDEKLFSSLAKQDTYHKFEFGKSTCGYIFYVDKPISKGEKYPKQRMRTVWFYDGKNPYIQAIKYRVNCSDSEVELRDSYGRCSKEDKYHGPFTNRKGDGFYTIYESVNHKTDKESGFKFEDRSFNVKEFKIKTSNAMAFETKYKWNAKRCLCENGYCDKCDNGEIEFNSDGKTDYFSIDVGKSRQVEGGELGPNRINIYSKGDKSRFFRDKNSRAGSFNKQKAKPYLVHTKYEGFIDNLNELNSKLYFQSIKKVLLYNEWQRMGNKFYYLDFNIMKSELSPNKRFVAATIDFNGPLKKQNKFLTKKSATPKTISIVKDFRMKAEKYPMVEIYDVTLRKPLKHKKSNHSLLGWIDSKKVLMQKDFKGLFVLDIETGKVRATPIKTFDNKVAYFL